MEENSINPQSENQTDQNVNKEQSAGSSGQETNKDARMWAMFVHLAALAGYLLPAIGWVIGPLLVWIFKKDEFPFVNEHGKEAINFQLSMFIYSIACGLLCFMCIGFVLLAALVVIDLVFMVIAAVTANNGQPYRYPLTIHLIK